MSDKESPSDFGSKSSEQVTRWLAEIKTYNKEFHSWEEKSKKIYNRYAGRCEDGETFRGSDEKTFNILWSNSQVLRPLIYARTPKPMVERRFKDSDRLARLTSEVLQRNIEFQVKRYRVDPAANAVRDDYLLPGRGIGRVLFEATYGQQIDPMTGQPVEILTNEKVCLKHVHFRDFGHGPARDWSEVSSVWFKSYLARDQLISRFGEIGGEVKLSQVANEAYTHTDLPADTYKKAIVYEIWDKDSKKVYWLSNGHADILDEKPDPYGLDNFFPCACPLYATLQHDNLIPTPDYLLYQAQAIELDDITQRKSHTIAAIKNLMLRDASIDKLDNLFNAAEGSIVAVQNMAQLVEKGGIEGVLFSVPVRDKIEILIQLYQAEESVKQEIYEITGLSDIIRGSSVASETATAQQIKGQYANLRLSSRQEGMQEFMAESYQLMGELIAEKFSPESIRMGGGYDYLADANPEDPEEFNQIMSLLRDDPLRRFRITIETDSTLAVDESLEKEKRTEALQSIGNFLGQTIPLAQATPQLTPLITEMIKFNLRTFTAGRQLEDVLEQSLQQFQDALMQPPPEEPPPDPMADPMVQIKMQEIQTKSDLKMQEMQMKHQLEINKLQQQYEVDSSKIMMENEKNRNNFGLEAAKLRNKNQTDTIAAVSNGKQKDSKSPVSVNINLGGQSLV